MEDTEKTIHELWCRYRYWLKANAPDALKALRLGASQQQLREAEQSMHVRLPLAVRASYLEHDGQEPDGPRVFEAGEFLSLQRMVELWQRGETLRRDGKLSGLKSSPLDETISTDWWHEAWIPLTSDGQNNFHCLDLGTPYLEARGQVIDYWHDEPTRGVEAFCFEDWLSDRVTGAETGEYVYSAIDQGIILAIDQG
jgi:cell wall assembly regulator SMI1